MTDPLGRSLNINAIDKNDGIIDDDASDITPTDTRNVKKNQHAVVEKVVKFRFEPQDRSKDPINPGLIHIQLIREVQKALGPDEVEVYDNKGKKVPEIDPLRWTNAHHMKVFDLHIPRRSTTSEPTMMRHSTGREQTVIIVHRIRTSWSLSEIKAIPTVLQLLRDHEVYLSEHRWKETIWNTTQLGFIVGLDPQFYNPEEAAKRLIQDIKKHTPGKPKIPHFRMAFCTPTVLVKGKGKRNSRTKAYAIETEKMNSMEMLRLLKIAYKDTGDFVPFQMRSKHPEAFLRAIQVQTQTMATNRTIVLNNIGTDAILYLSHWIENIDGVKDIVPCRTVETDGKFRILVKQQDFHRVRNVLIENLSQWISDYVASDAQPQPGRFPGDPEVAPLYSDALSNGNNSYMATSVNTMMSYNENEFAEYNPPHSPARKSSTKPSSNPWSGSTTMSSPLVSDQTTWADRVTQQRTSRVSTELTPTLNSDEKLEARNDHDPIAIDQIKTDLQMRNAEVESLKQELHDLKRERAQYKQELDNQVQLKVNEAIQKEVAKLSPSSVSDTQVESLLALQNKQFQEFSIQVLQMIQAQNTIVTTSGNPVIVATGKRSVGTDGETSSLTDSYIDHNEERKRIDKKPTPRKLPFTTSEEIPELPESPFQHYSIPTLDWSSPSPEENTQMELDPLELAMPKATTSQGTYAKTVPPAERREMVESSCHESNPSKQYPLEGSACNSKD